VVTDPQARILHERGTASITGDGRASEMLKRAQLPDVRQGISALIEAILQVDPLDMIKLYDTIPASVSKYARCRRVIFYLVRDGALRMVGSSAETTGGFTSTLIRIIPNYDIPLATNTDETEAIRKRQIKICPASENMPQRIMAPLIGSGGPIGLLALVPAADDPPSWGGNGVKPSQTYLKTLEDIASAVAIVLENRILLYENRQRTEAMDLLASLTNALSHNIFDKEAIVRVLELQISRLTHADRCAVILGEDLGQSRSWIHPEILRQIFHFRASFLSYDVNVWQLSNFLPEDICSFYAVPLMADNRAIGAFALGFTSEHRIDHQERNLLDFLTNTISTMLHRAHLYAETEQARAQTKAWIDQVQYEQRFKDAILRNIQSGLITVDLEGKVKTINPLATKLLGLGDIQVIGLPIDKVAPGLNPLGNIIRKGEQLGSCQRKVSVLTATKQEITLEVIFAPIRLVDSKDLGIMCTFQDLTALYEMVTQNQENEQVATNVKKISHDLRNILHAIILGITIFREPGLSEDDTQRTVSQLQVDLDRMRTLLENLKYNNRSMGLNKKQCHIDDLINKVLDSLGHRLKQAQIETVLKIDPGLIVSIDEIQMYRAIENLCLNAIEAMPPNGTLTISARSTRTGQQLLAHSGATEPIRQSELYATEHSGSETRPGEPRRTTMRISEPESETILLMPNNSRQHAVEITIRDTGKGIPAELLKEIWEPFKSFGKQNGTGLGLDIVHQIIKSHEGSVSVSSEVGKGTVFAIRLPDARPS
jgi:PAS domain S-box-containing protein